MNEEEFKKYVENIDSWVKQLKTELDKLQTLPKLIEECQDNIQHNYELIYELKDEIEELKQEINAIKLIQIMSIKQKMNEKEMFGR